MSRSSSSSSDTSRPNTTAVSEFQPMIPCQHPRPKMWATHVRIWHHRMWDSCVFQYITHDSALVTWHCRECNRRSFQTFEFATGGKTDHWGRYLRHQSKEKRHDVNIDEADVDREFKLMRGRGCYNILYYNCKDWAKEFVENILAKTRGEDEKCGCLQFHFRTTSIEVHRNLRDYVNLVRFECTNCRRENMIISFVYTERGKGTRWGCYVNRYAEQRHHYIGMPFNNLRAVYDAMPGQESYAKHHYDTFHWAKAFYKNITGFW